MPTHIHIAWRDDQGAPGLETTGPTEPGTKQRRGRGTWRALAGLGLGMAMVAGGGIVGVASISSTSVASAATSNAQAPIPVVEQNLDSAGRIRVAAPTNANGQVQTSNGNAAATAMTNGCALCWVRVWPNQTVTLDNIQGSGVFTGLVIDTCECWDNNNNPDGVITLTIDGQTILNGWMSQFGANWLRGSNELGGQWCTFWNCGGAIMHFFPPEGISFHSSVVVTYWRYAWAGTTAGAFGEVYYNSITPVTSSPN